MIAHNAVKEAAATRRPIRGLHLTFAAYPAIEVLAGAQLDFIYIDGEHGCFDWRDVEVTCITAERHGLTPIARVPDASGATITRFLDRGVRGIVVPHVESVEDVRRVVNAASSHPRVPARSARAGRRYWPSATDRAAYMRACNASLSLCMMIESVAGLAAAEAVARLPEVDYLSFGMLDLAQSLGHAGDPAHPHVQRAVADCVARGTGGFHALRLDQRRVACRPARAAGRSTNRRRGGPFGMTARPRVAVLDDWHASRAPARTGRRWRRGPT